jgi:hypothetical protein
MPVVEYVYGRFQDGRFTERVQPGGLEDLSERQLRNELQAARVEIPVNAPLDVLRKLVAQERTLAA